MEITARGQFNKADLIVEIIDDEMYFNGKSDVFLETELKSKLQKIYPIGGTYYPKEKDPLNYYNVLKNHFFDNEPLIETDEILKTIPSKKGRIY